MSSPMEGDDRTIRARSSAHHYAVTVANYSQLLRRDIRSRMNSGRTYREWGRRGPAQWVYVALIVAVAGTIIGLLVTGGK